MEGQVVGLKVFAVDIENGKQSEVQHFGKVNILCVEESLGLVLVEKACEVGVQNKSGRVSFETKLN